MGLRAFFATQPVWQRAMAGATLLIVAVLVFARLGHYALWDDEANTALIGKGVWATGDTSAVIGHNIVAFRGGGELKNLHVRYLPPLQYYLVAPFVGPGGPSSFRARLPFAIAGFSAFVLMLYWLASINRDPALWTAICIGLICNVSLILYCRQCRYYAAAVLFSVAIAYLYSTFRGGAKQIVAVVVCSLLLLSANYMSFLALYICLGVDYVIWGRKRHWITWRQLIAIVAPQIALGLIVVLIWNPLGKQVMITNGVHEGLLDKLKLLWWNIRDMAVCEFIVLPLLVTAPVMFWFRRETTLLARGPLAIAIYVLVVTAVSPQTMHNTDVADIRYLAPLIPLCIAVAAVCIRAISGTRVWLAALIALLAFATNLLNGGTVLDRSIPTLQLSGMTSTICRYCGELIHPAADPYTRMADWINRHVKDDESIWTVMDYQTYPLMYHAPGPIYAWQLDPPAKGQFAGQSAIQFKGQELPNYIIACGPGLTYLMQNVKFPPGVLYMTVQKIDTAWRDFYRPELYWRTFGKETAFDHSADVIYIFKGSPAAAPPPAHSPAQDFRL